MTQTVPDSETARQKAIDRLRHYRSNFEAFAQDHLRIEPKDPFNPLVPLKLNKAQRYIHKRLEDQRRRTGKVRALILKGRQQGASTYIGGRFYHRAALNKAIKVYILTHEIKATNNLFDMVDRYQINNPLRPHVGESNVTTLEFDRLGSRYRVATAGQKAGGRSGTNTLFHGSEVAFWPNAKDHFSSSVQTVPDIAGTEIILESTANGAAGEFYERWQNAEAEIGDYQAIFVPWYWDEGYTREVDETFELSSDPDDTGISEIEYAESYGLSMGQMAWRRAKIAELGPVLFRQEYPATASEAFQTSDEDTFIKPASVLRARKSKEIEAAGPLIMGGDPAGAGGDRFAVAYRRGYVVEKVEWRDKVEPVEAVEWLASLIDKHDPARFNIDAGGIGAAIISHLRAKGPKYAKVVRAINFGAKSQHKHAKPRVPGPVNRRAEMWNRSKEWLDLEEGVQIPDMDVLQSDACSPRIKPKVNNDFLLEAKDEMRKRGARSPDLWDAVALTFADLSWIKNYTEKKKVNSIKTIEPGNSVQRTNYARTLRHGWMV